MRGKDRSIEAEGRGREGEGKTKWLHLSLNKEKLIKYIFVERKAIVKYFLDNFVDIIVYLLSAVKRIEK